MHDQTIRVDHALRTATERLTTTSPTPRLDAEVLLAHVLGVGRAGLLADMDRLLTAAEAQAFDVLLERRAALEPVAYLVGHKEFYSLEFVVDRRVLVPRPETELLVDLALQWSKARSTSALTVADIGTGSGCIAVTLAVHLSQAHVWAVDLSADALDVARSNAERHAVGDRITFVQGDGVAPLPQPVDLVVSNPPYTILSDVDPNVYRWEPHLALDGHGNDGFDVPARLLQAIPPLLRPGGAVLMEIGAWQGGQALRIAQAVFPTARCRLHQDLAGHDRVLAVQS